MSSLTNYGTSYALPTSANRRKKKKKKSLWKSQKAPTLSIALSLILLSLAKMAPVLVGSSPLFVLIGVCRDMRLTYGVVPTVLERAVSSSDVLNGSPVCLQVDIDTVQQLAKRTSRSPACRPLTGCFRSRRQITVASTDIDAKSNDSVLLFLLVFWIEASTTELMSPCGALGQQICNSCALIPLTETEKIARLEHE